MAHTVKSLDYTVENGSHLKNGSDLENRSHCENWVTFDNNGPLWKIDQIWKQMCHTEKWDTFGKNGSHCEIRNTF